ncbi:MAG: hypothetical protein R3B95_07690 [Nitrospirales bacterium]|nr:hypothetical protein [Nitrospirales bacterium]
MKTPMGIAPVARRWMRWRKRANSVGAMIQVLDLDIRQFFDTLDHALVMRAVRQFTTCKVGSPVHRAMATGGRAIAGWDTAATAVPGHPRAGSSAHFWRISFCTSASTSG